MTGAGTRWRTPLPDSGLPDLLLVGHEDGATLPARVSGCTNGQPEWTVSDRGLPGSLISTLLGVTRNAQHCRVEARVRALPPTELRHIRFELVSDEIELLAVPSEEPLTKRCPVDSHRLREVDQP